MKIQFHALQVNNDEKGWWYLESEWAQKKKLAELVESRRRAEFHLHHLSLHPAIHTDWIDSPETERHTSIISHTQELNTATVVLVSAPHIYSHTPSPGRAPRWLQCRRRRYTSRSRRPAGRGRRRHLVWTWWVSWSWWRFPETWRVWWSRSPARAPEWWSVGRLQHRPSAETIQDVCVLQIWCLWCLSLASEENVFFILHSFSWHFSQNVLSFFFSWAFVSSHLLWRVSCFAANVFGNTLLI